MAAEEDTDRLLDEALGGDPAAIDELLNRHRPMLRQMIAFRMDQRLSTRIDPSDIVQEAMLDASNRLSGYLQDRPLPFYPWLRQIAWQRLVDAHRRHILADRRTVNCEEAAKLDLPDKSAACLARLLLDSEVSPSENLAQQEARERVRAALDDLSALDREVLTLIYLEQLSIADTGAVLGVTARAATMRHLRALKRIRNTLDAANESEA